jgi:hypothetical protein
MRKLRKWLIRKLGVESVYVVTTTDDDAKIRNYLTNSHIAAQRQYQYWCETFGGSVTALASRKLEYFDPF